MSRVLAWLSVAALAALPWAALRAPWLAPAVAVAGVVSAAPWRPRRGADPEGSLLEAGSAGLAIWSVSHEALPGWLALAAVVALVGWAGTRRPVPRPDAADLVALVGWGGAPLIRPEIVAHPGAWVAPAVLLVAARRIALPARRRAGPGLPGPPAREVRGRLVLDGVVAPDENGLPALPPLDLEVAPGESVALVCDDPSTLAPVVEVVAGRRAPAAGTVTVDGEAPDPAAPVVAVVARGERFVPGDLESNLAALREQELEPAAALAARESCALDTVERALDGCELDAEGEPLGELERLLVLAARVLVSAYRVVVVLDPVPWVNAARGEAWRRAVVRASVGRTALWITADRELARRAHRTVLLRAGAWQEVER